MATEQMESDQGRVLDFGAGGMTCGSCAARVQRVLRKQPGVADAEVNFATGKARVVTTPEADVESLKAAVGKIGYELTPASAGPGQRSGPTAAERAEAAEQAEEAHRRMWLLRTIAVAPAALFMLSTMLYHDFAMHNPVMRWVQLGIATPVQFWVGWPFLREAVRRARRFTANMDTLIAMGTMAAYLFSVYQLAVGGMELYFEAAVVIIAFIVLVDQVVVGDLVRVRPGEKIPGRYLEARAKGRAGKAIRALLELGAKEARVIRDGVERMVPSPDRFSSRPLWLAGGRAHGVPGGVRDGDP